MALQLSEPGMHAIRFDQFSALSGGVAFVNLLSSLDAILGQPSLLLVKHRNCALHKFVHRLVGPPLNDVEEIGYSLRRELIIAHPWRGFMNWELSKEFLWIEESNQRFYAYNHFEQRPERLIGSSRSGRRENANERREAVSRAVELPHSSQKRA